MRRPWALLLLLLLELAAAAPIEAYSPGAAPQVIKDCVQRVGPTLRGLEALSAECPDIAAAIHDLHIDTQLPADWQQHVSTRTLEDWTLLASRYAGAAPQTLPDTASLQAIVRQLPQPPTPPPSLWELLGRWIESWLAAGHARWPVSGPLFGLNASLLEVLSYALLAAVIITAVVVVINELRAAGVLAEKRRQPAPRRSALPAHTSPPAQLEAAEPHQNPVQLLRSLVAALTDSQRLEHERDLTCRELITAARFDSSTQRELFAGIALLAEQALYDDPSHAPPPVNNEVLSGAHALTGQLLTPPAAHPS